MNVLALDPGPDSTAYTRLVDGEIHEHGYESNIDLLNRLRCVAACPRLAVEMIASYGMPVGREVFETCVWIGRFVEAWGGKHALVYRRDVKLHLCHNPNARDSNVRQAILDRFPRTGGGATPQVGTKAKPGPLYGFAGDQWAALGVALTYAADPDKFLPLGATA